MNPTTIYDVARLSGVSISTVSNALNRPGRVNAETRTKVLQAADDLGYVPKTQAVSLARKGMRRIAVLAPFSSYSSFYERLSGVLVEASAAGVEVSVFDHESAATASTPLLASMPIQGQIDGLIVMGQSIEHTVEQRLHERSVPTVLVDASSVYFPTVTCNDFDGGALAARHLLEAGHRRILYVVERQLSSYESQAVVRLDGFKSEISKCSGATLTTVESEPSTAAVRERVRDVLKSDLPTAVMAHYDDMAVGVLHAAKDLDLAVPVGLSVMGYDDGPAARATDLTTVAQPFRESGVIAARILLAEISSPGQPQANASLKVHLVHRQTVRVI